MAPPPGQQSAIADALSGNGAARPRDSVRDQMYKKVDNFVEALAGAPLPANWQSSEWTRGHLGSILGVNFDSAVDQYMAFEKMPSIKQFFTRKLAGHEISNKVDPYATDILARKIPRARAGFDESESTMQGPSSDPAYQLARRENLAYARKMVDGLEEVLRDKDLRAKAIKALLDFHGLADPVVPFVRSKVEFK